MSDITQNNAPMPQADSTFKKLTKSIGLLRESPIAIFGLCLVMFWVIVALLAPFLPVRDPNAQDSAAALAFILPDQYNGPLMEAPDGGNYWLGTDGKGRDLLARMVWGSRLVLFWAGLATLVAYTVGMLLGVIAGYRGGWWDEAISFLCNVLLSFPLMVLYLVILTQFGPASPLGQTLADLGLSRDVVQGVIIIIAVTFGTAPAVARIVRGLVLDLKTRDYIAAAQVRGESPFYIMLIELLPNARGPLIVDACLRLGYVIITIALLGYLALGLPPPDADWGKMIAEGQAFGSFGANSMLWPAMAISSLVLGLNLLADGIREISLRD